MSKIDSKDKEKQSSDALVTTGSNDQVKVYTVFFYNDVSHDNLYGLLSQLGQIEEKPSNVHIDLVLCSGGGDPEAAYLIARTLRSVCSTMTTLVPLYAKSAATLISLASDEIILAPQSHLGPLDMQICHPQDKCRRISSIDHVGSVEHLGDLKRRLTIEYARSFQYAYNIGDIEALKLAVDSATSHIDPMIAQLDPIMYYNSCRSLDVGEDYAYQLLHDYMLKDSEQSKRVARKLVKEYKTHSYAIDITEATKTGLKVVPSSQYECWNDTYQHNLTMMLDSHQSYSNLSYINVMNPEEFSDVCSNA